MDTTVFPRAERGRLGYHPEEVDQFLAEAKSAYDGQETSQAFGPEVIRTHAFRLKRGGYSTTHVDLALERLEDVFAARARNEAVLAGEDEAMTAAARATAQAIVNRLARPAQQKFRHAGVFTLGYRRSEVDQFCDKVMRYFTEAWPLTPTDVRSVAFAEQRGGYRQDQVDALLDAVIEVMLAVR